MSLVSRYRLQFLIAWLALDPRTRAQVSPRQVPAVVGLLAQARAMQQALRPWVEALLIQRQRLAWTFALPSLRGRLAALVQEDLALLPFDPQELRHWQASHLQFLLEAELARLIRLLEAPTLLMLRPGWKDHWEAARWGLATCLARIAQLQGALAQRRYADPSRVGLPGALGVVWQRLTAGAAASAA